MLASIAGLIAGCLLVGVVVGPILLAFDAAEAPVSTMLKASVLGLFISFFAMMFGFLPALLYGAPLYAWLRRSGRANLVTAVGRTSHVPLPLAAAAQQLFLIAEAAGLGAHDDSSVVTVLSPDTQNA